MTSSYNGWTASRIKSEIDVQPFRIAGVDFPGGVKGGDVSVVLGYVAEQFFKRVEKAVTPGCWGYNFRKNRNSNNLSCHSSATAIDINAPKHSNGKAGTFTARQVHEIRLILAEVDHIITWGGDFHHTKDEMHFEIATGVNAAAVKKVADKILKLKAAAPRKNSPVVVTKPADPRLHAGVKDTKTSHKVADIQRALVKHGYKVVVDGEFGPGTERGLKAFQTAKGLNPDGITWAGTWAELRKPKAA